MLQEPVCPACGSTKTMPIVYGMPSPQLFAEQDAGHVALGGCVLLPEAPDRHCVACDARFVSRESHHTDEPGPLDMV